MNTNGGDNQARVSKAALLMLKARVVMYKKDSSKYAEVAADMAEIINSHAFGLMSDFDSIWGNEGEFCKESIFESNQLPTGKGWGNAWGGYGTNLPAFISPNELNDPDGIYKGGWGFGPVRVEAWEMYEDGDVRREGSINDWRNKGSYGARFQNTGLFQKKYAARIGYNDLPGDQDLNYANNLRIFRYAETLLNYAELVAAGTAEQGGVSAQACLDEIRARAGVGSIALSTANVKLERRKEFLGEGMRFWDLIRWGDAEAALTENDPANNTTRTFKTGKDEFVPIPQSEMSRTAGTDYALTQNKGY